MGEEDFKHRIILEEQELSIKLEKLKAFYKSPTFEEITERERYLLLLQGHYMRRYLGVLRMRVELYYPKRAKKGEEEFSIPTLESSEAEA